MRGRGVIDGPFLNFSTQGLASFLKFRPIKGRIFLSAEFLKTGTGVYLIAYYAFNRHQFNYCNPSFQGRICRNPAISLN